MAQTTVRSLSTASTHQELYAAVAARIKNLKSITPQDGAPLECSVYSGLNSKAFPAGDSGKEVYRLRTNILFNKAAFLAAVAEWMKKSTTLPLKSGNKDEATALSTYYDLESIHVVQAQVWSDNEKLELIRNFGSGDKAVMGMLNKEEFTTKDGEVVTTWRLNRVTFQGAETLAATSMQDDELSFLTGATATAPAPAAPAPAPVMAAAPAAPAATVRYNTGAGAFTAPELLASGWSQAQIDALPQA